MNPSALPWLRFALALAGQCEQCVRNRRTDRSNHRFAHALRVFFAGNEMHVDLGWCLLEGQQWVGRCARAFENFEILLIHATVRDRNFFDQRRTDTHDD